MSGLEVRGCKVEEEVFLDSSPLLKTHSKGEKKGRQAKKKKVNTTDGATINSQFHEAAIQLTDLMHFSISCSQCSIVLPFNTSPRISVGLSIASLSFLESCNFKKS